MWLHGPHILLSLRVAWIPQMGLLLYNHFVQNFDDMELSYCGYYYFLFLITALSAARSIHSQTIYCM
jgi:hypothetical protein